jgi:DNA-directed RNA polymerase subunit RPC12/RpoP
LKNRGRAFSDSEFDAIRLVSNDDPVQPAGFLCPECSAPLRLNDRSQIGREIDCPDCGKRLRIVADAGEVRAVRAAEPMAFQLPPRPGSRSTLRLIWFATACLGVVVLWVAARPTTPEARLEKSKFEDSSPAVPIVAAEPVMETPKAEPPPSPIIQPPKLPEPHPPQANVAAADNRPFVPELAAELPAVDVTAQLSLRIEEFSQTRPAQVRLLLRQIAELSAVPVDLSAVEIDPWRAKLDRAVSVELKQTTVGKVLDEILKQAELSYRHKDGVIFVTPSDRPGL